MSDSNFIQQLAQKLRMLGAMHAVGETWISFDGTVPAGGVPCCGQTVSRALYADLWAWAQAKGKVKTETEWQSAADAQNGNCIYFGEGDGTTTFRMPKLTGYFKGSASASEAGKWIAEGLPNATGTWPGDLGSKLTPSGAVYIANEEVNSDSGAGLAGVTDTLIGIDLSRSNPIYGNSDHVTPETNTILIGVYALNVLTNSGTADIADLQSALATLEAEVSTGLSSKLSAESGGGQDAWWVQLSNGLIVQWGVLREGITANFTVTLAKPFQGTDYFALAAPLNDSDVTTGLIGIYNKTTSTFMSRIINGSAGVSAGFRAWFAIGF